MKNKIRHFFLFTIVFVLPHVLYAETILENPLGFKSISSFVASTLHALVKISLPVVGFFIVLSGFMFVTARGNKDRIETAKKNFAWVIAGAILILGAWSVALLLQGTIEKLKTGV